jgi:hypothetical protein
VWSVLGASTGGDPEAVVPPAPAAPAPVGVAAVTEVVGDDVGPNPPAARPARCPRRVVVVRVEPDPVASTPVDPFVLVASGSEWTATVVVADVVVVPSADACGRIVDVTGVVLLMVVVGVVVRVVVVVRVGVVVVVVVRVGVVVVVRVDVVVRVVVVGRVVVDTGTNGMVVRVVVDTGTNGVVVRVVVGTGTNGVVVRVVVGTGTNGVVVRVVVVVWVVVGGASSAWTVKLSAPDVRPSRPNPAWYCTE